MRCPFCGYENTKVVDSRIYFEGNSIKRRRECEKCGKRFTTHEKVVDLSLYVKKFIMELSGRLKSGTLIRKKLKKCWIRLNVKF